MSVRMAPAWLIVLSLAFAGNAAAWAQSAYPDEPKTLKERLSNKASDEQRVDNCHVPPAQRGPTPRPDCGNQQNAKLTLAPPR
jgi:hypothetical protein